jgi:anti-anti-sigma factor
MSSERIAGPPTVAVASEPGVEAFRVEVHPDGQTARVVPVGELDLATADQVDEQLQALTARGFRRLVLDLRRLAFLNSTGLRLAICWDARARRDGIDFSLVAGCRGVQRAFDLTGLTDVLTFTDA